jgi:hypothetical protein
MKTTKTQSGYASPAGNAEVKKQLEKMIKKIEKKCKKYNSNRLIIWKKTEWYYDNFTVIIKDFDNFNDLIKFLKNEIKQKEEIGEFYYVRFYECSFYFIAQEKK